MTGTDPPDPLCFRYTCKGASDTLGPFWPQVGDRISQPFCPSMQTGPPKVRHVQGPEGQDWEEKILSAFQPSSRSFIQKGVTGSFWFLLP